MKWPVRFRFHLRLSTVLATFGLVGLALAAGLFSGQLSLPPRGTSSEAEAIAPSSPSLAPLVQRAEPSSQAASSVTALPNDTVADILPSAASSPSPAAPPSQDVVEVPTALQIASIKLSTKVVPTEVLGGVWQVADNAAGYLDGSGVVGQPGNLALAGHDDIQGAVFRQLKTVKVGAPVVVSSTRHDYRYVVNSIRYVAPSDTSVLNSSSDTRLTLITCWPDFFTPKFAYNSLRLVVQARLAP